MSLAISRRSASLALLFSPAATLTPLHAADPPGASESRRLHALFAEAWERSARDYPEWATYRGDKRFNDRLTDNSAAAIAAREAEDRRTLQRALTFRPEALSRTDRLSHEVFVYGLRQQVRFQAFKGYNSLALGSTGGFHTNFSQLLGNSPAASRAEVEQMLARMAAFPHRVDQEIARMRVGIGLGWVPSRPVLDRVIEQIDAQLPTQTLKSPFYEPFAKLGAGISGPDQQILRDKARLAIEQQVVPGMRRLRSFVVDEYQPKAPADGSLGKYPGGAKVYEAVVEEQTTTRMSVRQIHELGLAQVARLGGEMGAVMRETGFGGDFNAFVGFLNTDPKFQHGSGAALLIGYRDIAKRIDAELPKLFAELPRAPYGVRAMPDYLGIGRAEFYDAPALDGTTAGWFNANLLAYKTRPIWGMETLVAHEAVPGHHLQTARATELKSLPEFRRDAGYTAYSEAGRSMRRPWAASWASTPTRTAASATCNRSCSAPPGWSSTPACMRWAGPASRRSTT